MGEAFLRGVIRWGGGGLLDGSHKVGEGAFLRGVIRWGRGLLEGSHKVGEGPS